MDNRKNLLTTILANVLFLVSGIIMIAGHNNADFLKTIILIFGLVFTFSGIIYIFQLLANRHEKDSEGHPQMNMFAVFASWIGCTAAIALGLFMCINPLAFLQLFTIVFGVSLVVAGIFNFYMLGFGLRAVRFPKWTFIIPLLVIAAGIIILCSKLDNNYIILTTGIGLVIFATGRFVEMIGRRSLSKAINSEPVEPDHRIKQ